MRRILGCDLPSSVVAGEVNENAENFADLSNTCPTREKNLAANPTPSSFVLLDKCWRVQTDPLLNIHCRHPPHRHDERLHRCREFCRDCGGTIARAAQTSEARRTASRSAEQLCCRTARRCAVGQSQCLETRPQRRRLEQTPGGREKSARRHSSLPRAGRRAEKRSGQRNGATGDAGEPPVVAPALCPLYRGMGIA
jgi:hypothetical protein